ncbi:MAG: hypothetical protein CR981_03745 [Proteobacteria bacterium]|nr:MAG: hypothetical protein CR981_03745 [Pseudomonadota bacterium]
MRRFYSEVVGQAGDIVSLDKEQSIHITRVLRFQPEDQVELFDGCGGVSRALIVSTGKYVVLRVVERLAQQLAGGPQLWLCQGDLKGKKMDLVVQKSTELGVSRLLSVISSRSQGRVSVERSKKKQLRWRKLMESACKQCGRLIFMETGEISFTELVTAPELDDCDLRLLFWEKEKACLLKDLDWRYRYKKICILLGPEGGFSEEEVALAKGSGWVSTGLGPLVLRAETAAIATASILLHRLGRI